MKLKSKKSALLMSFTSLLICFAMLVGSTFAWFTDTATTGVNKIQAGNLKVELLDKEGEKLAKDRALTWVKAAGAGETEVLWEPKCTYELEPFQIKNAGNLALKYRVVLKAGNISKTADGKSLLDVIEWTVKVGDEEIKKNELFADLANGVVIVDGAKLTAEENANTVMISVTGHMMEEAGNDYQGLSIEGFGITVQATQATHEFDSISDQYDKDATYLAPGEPVETEADLIKVIENGGEVSITKDIALNSTVQIAGDTVIHGNGNTIKMSKTDTNLFQVNGSQETKLVLDNVVMDGDGQNLGKAFPISNGGKGTVEISNCTIKNFSGTRAVHSEQADTVKIVNTIFEDITLTGVSSGSNNNGRACLLWLQGTEVLLENVTIRNCKALTDNNNSSGSGVLIYARNSGTNVTARNLVVENNIVSNHVFATYSTTNANNYIFESGSMKGNTVVDGTTRASNEIIVVGNVTIGEGMTIEQNIIINNDSNNGVCTLTNNGTIVGDISSADWAVSSRGKPIYTGTGTLNGLTIEQLKNDAKGYLSGVDIQ